jgi:hypothetical protein
MNRRLVVGLAAGWVLCVNLVGATATGSQLRLRARYVTAAEAASVLDSYASLPSALRTGAPAPRAALVDTWIRTRDREIRARVFRGEEDALVPLLLFGVSFTRAPRLTRAFFDDLARSNPLLTDAERERSFTAVFEQRLDDLLDALAGGSGAVRLAWARAVIQRTGVTLADRAATARYLIETFARVTRESEILASRLAGPVASDAGPAERAHAFASRGLAVDTSWPANFAVAEALASLLSKGVLDLVRPVHRVAIVGPGLDIIDKDEGFDHYPPQSLQPFAIADVLGSLGLLAPGGAELLTLDVSPRVIDHLRAARLSRQPYLLHLVANERPWTNGAMAYWSAFGKFIGEETTPSSAPAVPVRGARALAVRPGWINQLAVIDANVVCQRIDLAPAERVDLVVATNILLYYDAVEQALAVSNLVHMLRPNGVLLTNTRLDASAVRGLRPMGETLTMFSSQPGDGEVVYAYARRAAP